LAQEAENEGATYFRIGFLKHSPNCKLVAFGVDYWGNERYTAKFFSMESKTWLPDQIEGIYEDFEFGNDSAHVYYTLLDDCERAYKVMRHHIGAPVTSDEMLHHEEDEMFFVTIKKSCDGKYIFVKLAAQITSETRYISAGDPKDIPHVLLPRRENIQYSCEHHQDHFYFLTNESAKNNYLMRTPVPPSSNAEHSAEFVEEHQETVIEHRDFVLIEDFHIRKNYLVVLERSNCLQNIRVVDLRNEQEDGFSNYHYVGFSEVVYAIWPGSVREEEANLVNAIQFDSDIFRFTYTSFVQPKQVIDYNMDTREMTIVHEETVGGPVPYNPSKYSSKRLYATGNDGTVIPVSIVFRRDLLGMNMSPPQHNPILLHAYGAYGSFTNLIFSASRLSLLDRGFIYAAAHVRGGADMGNGWYEEGKLAKKPNTFHDFCSVAEYLIKEGYTSPEKMAIYGRSAGGLLIGSVINMRPDLFRTALTEVPFVDVINTMFDTSIPWTAFGNHFIVEMFVKIFINLNFVNDRVNSIRRVCMTVKS
jgi:oligopeptidase B